jgi:hypothetical protein
VTLKLPVISALDDRLDFIGNTTQVEPLQKYLLDNKNLAYHANRIVSKNSTWFAVNVSLASALSL